jgi:hypothetical protein
MAPNETPTLHFEGDLAVVVHPHACHESCELQGKERRFPIGRTEGVNVLTSRKQRVFESQLGMLNRTDISASNVPARAWDHWSSFFAAS